MEAIRIIKEMRRATNGNYPKFAIFENVTGIFSSNHGEDFRVVLEEFIQIAESRATMPPMPRGGWPYADCYVGDGWSIAYRTFDTQYWGKTIRDPATGVITQRGTPQRRRRLYLTACFTSECAYKILFEREGLQGDPAQGQSPWEGITANAGSSTTSNDRSGSTLITQCSAGSNDIASTVCASYGTKWNGNAGAFNGENFVLESIKACVVSEHAFSNQEATIEVNDQFLFESHAQDARYKGPLPVCPVISAKYGTGGLNQPFIVNKDDANDDAHSTDFQERQGVKDDSGQNGKL